MAEEKRRSRERGAFRLEAIATQVCYRDWILVLGFSSGLTGVDVPCKRLELVPDFFV